MSPPAPEARNLEPYHLVRFAGYLDISRYPEFRAAFEAVPTGIPVLIDLTGVAGVDSTFLSEMVLLKRRHAGSFATLISPGGHVARVFEIANVGEKLSAYTDLAAALHALGVRGAAETAGEEVGAE